MARLFNPPNVFDLPLSKGGDLYVAFRYMPLVVDGDGQPVLDGQGRKQYAEADYPAGASLTLTIDAKGDADPIITLADIDGSLATVHEDAAVVATVGNGHLWRAVLTYADGLDQVLCNGVTKRYDGKAKP